MAEIPFYGETLRTAEDRPKAALLEFSEATASVEDADNASLARYEGTLLSLARACVHPEDQGKFRRLMRQNNAGADELVTMVIGPALEAIADRPTRRSSDSSDGPSSIEPKSDSSSDVTVSPTPISSPVEEKVAAAFPNRPDKQGVVLELQSLLDRQTG